MGPLGRDFRLSFSDVTETALFYGECIMYDGEVISPQFYRMVERTPRSCYKCGISGWCIELTMDDHGAPRYICEGCVSRGFKPRNGATCGTKFCKYFQCPHNVYFNAGTAAMRDVMRTHGQLGRAAEDRRALRSAVNEERLLCSSTS
jgi:hypothetical protein